MSLKIEILEKNAIKQIILQGRLDSTTSLELEKTLQDLFSVLNNQTLTGVVIDFFALDYVSSAGLRVILMTAKRAKQTKSRLILCNLQPHVKEVFEISGFLKILEVSDNLNTALEQIR